MAIVKRSGVGVLISLIFLFGLFLRFYNLHLNSPQLYADETAGGYHILNIIQNSPNYLSRLFFQSFSFVWIFGLTPLGVRASSAVYGSLLILAIYFFAKKVNGSSSTALIAALLISVLPASFVLSRYGAPHVSIIAILTCIHAGLFLQAGKISSYLLSFLPIVAAFFYYPSFVVFAPLILALTFFYGFKIATGRQKEVLIFLSLVAIAVLAVIFIFKFNGFSTTSRGIDLAIWNDVNLTADHNLYRGIAGEGLLTSLVYNRPLSLGRAFIRNYASFFSPDWLFFRGDPVLRHSTGMIGAFFPILAPFLIYGAFEFFRSKKINSKTRIFFLTWILISPIPAALTSDGAGYLLRVVTLIPFFTYLSAYGIAFFYKLIKPRLLKFIYIITVSFALIFSIYSFVFSYFKVYPTLAAQSFEYGFKDLSDFWAKNNNSAMLIIWQGNYPKNHFYFWQKIPFGQTLDNLYFAWPASKKDLDGFLAGKMIKYLAYPASYLTNNPEYKPSKKAIKTIYYPNGKTAFSIFKID